MRLKFKILIYSPPSAIRVRRARRTNSFDPIKTDPTGAHNDLHKLNTIESKSRAIRDTSTSKYSAALKTRAPSMCIFILRFLQIVANSSIHSNGITLPPHKLCVFSTITKRILISIQNKSKTMWLGYLI